MRLIIVGQAPGRPNGKPQYPLAGRCGRRLAELLGIEFEQYLSDTCRLNLADRWPGASASGKGDLFPYSTRAMREVARFSLLLKLRIMSRPVLIVGFGVADALRLREYARPLRRYAIRGGRRRWIAYIPHTSGVCRWWNDEKNLRAAKRFLRGVARECWSLRRAT